MLDSDPKNNNTFTRNLNFLSRMAIILFAFISLSYFLKDTSDISIPVTVGVLLGLTFSPLALLFRKYNIPRHFAILISVLIFLALSFGILTLLYSSLTTVTDYFSFYLDKINVIIDPIVTRFSYLDKTFLEEMNTGFFSFLRNSVFSISQGILSFGSSFILATLALVFTMVEYFWLHEKIKMIRKKRAQEKKFVKALENINSQIGRFLFFKTLISLATAIVIFVGFTAIGVNFPILWAILTFLFNFIPSVGSIIISVISIAFCILQFYPSWTEVIIATVLILATQNIIGSIIDPAIMGDRLNLSPLFILFGFLYWSYVWGVVGMFLSVPLLVITRIVLQYIPYLSDFSMLLGSGAIAARNRKRRSMQRKKAIELRKQKQALLLTQENVVKEVKNETGGSGGGTGSGDKDESGKNDKLG